MDKRKKLLLAVLVLALIGVVVSAWLIKVKYGGSEFCEINAKFSCDIVNSSKFSEIFGIPVAVLGVLAYGFIAKSAFFNFREWKFKNKYLKKLFSMDVLFGFSIPCLAFALYLSYIESFILKAYCILCLTSQATILVIFFILWYMKRKWR